MSRFINTKLTADNVAGTTYTKKCRIAHQFGYSVSYRATDESASYTPKNFDSGVYEVQTLTFPAFASITDADYIVVEAQDGTSYAVYADKTGSTVAPTGALYVAADHKVKADISGATTAAQVAAIFETAFNSLTNFTSKITTDDTAADGTMLLTQTAYGPTTNPVPKNENDSGAGSLTGVQTTAGVAQELSVANNTITIPSHGFVNNLKVQATTTGTLPAGLSLATDYYVIVVDANTISLSATAGGVAVDITNNGTGVHTLTLNGTMAAVITIQASNDDPGEVDEADMIWHDLPDPVTINPSTLRDFDNISDAYYHYIRFKVVVTAGVLSADMVIFAKG